MTLKALYPISRRRRRNSLNACIYIHRDHTARQVVSSTLPHILRPPTPAHRLPSIFAQPRRLARVHLYRLTEHRKECQMLNLERTSQCAYLHFPPFKTRCMRRCVAWYFITGCMTSGHGAFTSDDASQRSAIAASLYMNYA